MAYLARSALHRRLVRAGEVYSSGACPGWACDHAVQDTGCFWSFRSCALRDGDNPTCVRDPDLRPEHGALTSLGDERQDLFVPIADWGARGWYPIAVFYGLYSEERWNRPEWRRERYQRRKAWKRR